MSELRLDPGRPDFANSGLTGVRQEWRRMGIATALKVSVLRAARERGLKRLITANAENQPNIGHQPDVGLQTPPNVAGLVTSS